MTDNLPDGWTKTTLGTVVEYGKVERAEKHQIPADAWILELEDVEKDTSRLLQRLTFAERDSKSTKNRFKKGDVLYGKLRPYLNKVLVADQDGFCTTEIIPISPNETINGRFLFHWLKNPEFLEYVNAVSYGLNMPRLGTKDGLAAPIVVPPLPEQKRIADKLDQMLARVDRCQAHLERIPQILKQFRQSVLAAATSGRLTEGWREKDGKSINTWLSTIPINGAPLPSEYDRLGKIAFKLTKIEHSAKELPETWALLTIADLYEMKVLIDFADGNHGAMYPRKEDFTGQGALFLTASQIGENWEVDITACPRLRSDKAQQLVKGWAKKNDVLLTHNATVGRVALLEYGEEDVLLGTSVTFYRFNENFISPNYGRILFSSPFFQDQLKMEMAQTTRNQVPITKQVSFNFICPPLEEQHEIVRRVERLFAFAERLEARWRSAQGQVGSFTPSLLAKAFRGELVGREQG